MTSNLPAFLQNKQAPALAKRLSDNLGIGSPPYISIMGNRFTLVDAVGAEEPVATYDPKTGPYLDCVIADIGDHISKIYYAKPFDPSASQYAPPDCWSDNGIAPSRNAPVTAGCGPTCAACPYSAWGSKQSAVSGKGIKACADFQKIAVVIPGDEVTFLLRVPPNSLSNLRAYTHKFVGQQVDISDVVTRIAFEAGTLGTLTFNAVSYIDEASFKRREALMAAKATDMLVGRNDQPRGIVLPAGQPVEQLAAPVQPAQAAATQPASFVPAATGPLPGVAQPAASPGGAAPATSLGEPAPARRPGRPRRAAAEPAQQAAPAETAQAGPAFGIAPGAPPPTEIEAALDSIFGPVK